MPVFICPTCSDPIFVDKIACGILRHGGHDGKALDPHCSEEFIKTLKKEKRLIGGCGAALVIKNGKIFVCDYKLRNSKEFVQPN